MTSQRGRFLALITALVLQLIYQLASPLSYKLIFDDGIGKGRNDILTFALGGLAVLLIGQAIGTILQETSIAHLAVRQMNELRGRLFTKLQAMPPQALAARSEAELTGLFSSDVAAVEIALVRAVPVTVLQGGVIVFSLLLLLLISWQLFLVTMTALPIVYFMPKGFASKAKIWQGARAEDSAKLLEFAQESISTSLIVRLFYLAQMRREKFDARLKALERSTVPAYRFTGLVGRTAFIGTGLSQLLVIGSGAFLAVQGYITAGFLVAFVGLLLRVSDGVAQLSTAIPLLIPAAAAQGRLQAFLDQRFAPLHADNTRPLETFSGEVEFDHVTFSYDSGRPILSDISFRVRPGERVALVGPSGCGKSTVLSLLMRLNRPQSGRILIDGVPLDEISEEALRRNLSVVPQVPILFDATIGENIIAGRPGVTHADVEMAAKAAGIHEAILRKPLGYNALARVTGGELSGGERQRIACARAFLRGAPLLLLDEATSALDAASEEIVNRSLGDFSGQSTIISVTHRLSGVVDYDRILVFESGVLIENGNHNELLALGGLYATLWSKQSGLNTDADDGHPSVTPERLAMLPFLSECKPEVLRDLARMFVPVRLVQGQTIVVQGDPGDNFYIIVRGRCDVGIRDKDGNSKIVAKLVDGDSFGELALVRSEGRAATVTATTDGWGLALARQHFLAIMNTDAEFRRKIEAKIAAIIGGTS
jgi:ATP-binding cassette subfamily B protein